MYDNDTHSFLYRRRQSRSHRSASQHARVLVNRTQAVTRPPGTAGARPSLAQRRRDRVECTPEEYWEENAFGFDSGHRKDSANVDIISTAAEPVQCKIVDSIEMLAERRACLVLFMKAVYRLSSEPVEMAQKYENGCRELYNEIYATLQEVIECTYSLSMDLERLLADESKCQLVGRVRIPYFLLIQAAAELEQTFVDEIERITQQLLDDRYRESLWLALVIAVRDTVRVIDILETAARYLKNKS